MPIFFFQLFRIHNNKLDNIDFKLNATVDYWIE